MIKRKGISELFQVNNDADGKQTIQVVKQLFKGTPFKVVVRGRHSNRRKVVEAVGERYYGKHQQDISVKLADRLAVYVVDKNTGVHMKNVNIGFDRQHTRLLIKENRNLRDTVDSIKNVLGQISFGEVGN